MIFMTSDCYGGIILGTECFFAYFLYHILIISLCCLAVQDMWDLTPDTDLLKELPDDYTCETALADLIVRLQFDFFLLSHFVIGH